MSTTEAAARPAMRPEFARVAVIGAGIVGVSTALFLITLTFVRFIVFDPPVRNLVRYDGLESVALASVQIDPRRGIDDFVERVLVELRRMPGVASASASTDAPYSTIRGAFGAGHTVEVTRPGQPFALRDPRYRTAALYVTPEFARTAGLTIVRGRFLTAADAASGMPAVAIDESIAQSVFGSLDVVGRTLLMRDDPAGASEAVIVGVTAPLGRAPADALARSQHLYAPFVSRPAGDPRLALYATSPVPVYSGYTSTAPARTAPKAISTAPSQSRRSTSIPRASRSCANISPSSALSANGLEATTTGS